MPKAAAKQSATPSSVPSGRDLALRIADILADTPATNIVVLDISDVSSFADYFLICSGDNERQLRAIQSAITEGVGHAGREVRRVEGNAESGWLVVDFADVIVHIFDAEEREYYRLEQLWEEAPVVLSIQ